MRFIFFLAAAKKLGVTYGHSLEMGPGSIIGMVAHFTSIFAPKLITLFCYVRVPSISKTDCCADRSILALPSAYQDAGDI